MDDDALPDAAHFSVLGSLESGKGGTTAVLLARHRLLEPMLRARGEHLVVLTFAPRPCAEHWERLEAEGLLLPGSDVRNLYRDLAGRRHDGGPPRPRAAPTGASDGAATPLDDRMVLQPWDGPEGRGQDVVRADGSLLVRISPSDDGERVAWTAPDGTTLGSWDGRDAFVRWWVEGQLPEGRTSVVVSDGHAVGAALAGLTSRPDVVVVQQLHNPHTGPAYAGLRRTASAFDRLVVLTERQRADLVAMDPACARNTVVVANPRVGASAVVPSGPRDEHRVVVLARIHRQKGLDRAVVAFRRLADEHGQRFPGLRLDVYGKVEDRALLTSLQELAGGDERIRFHGHRPDAREQLASAHVLWLTSRFEGYGLAILEAFEAGALVVANDCAYGPAELVDDGRTGFLVRIDDGDVAPLVEATVRAFTLPADEADAMRAGALAVARSGHHDPGTYRQAWVGLLRDAVAEHPDRVAAAGRPAPWWRRGRRAARDR